MGDHPGNWQAGVFLLQAADQPEGPAARRARRRGEGPPGPHPQQAHDRALVE
ncbi:MAG: hypothetical protein H7Y22_18625 [Gemmatimonadaceae bacterium]|nr:hypothetical protein [Gloeobacterales cyanobacterium ES-bin-141]